MDNSHWLLRGPDGKNGPSIYANICIGGYPNGNAKIKKGNTLNNNSLVSLLTAGIDTFVCLMTKKEIHSHENDLGLLKVDLDQSKKKSNNKSNTPTIRTGSKKTGKDKPAVSNFAMGEAEKEFNLLHGGEEQKARQRLGKNPPHYKIELIQHHSRMKKAMEVGK